MSTTTAINMGYEWSTTILEDPSRWGSETTEEQANELGSLVVARFDELAAANGSTASWHPWTSEVLYEVDDSSFTGEDLEAWHEQAGREIWEAWCEGRLDIP